MIPLLHPYVSDAMRQNVASTLESRWIGQGPRVDEFEQQFQRQVAPDYRCVATGSGTDALHLAYLLAGIKRGSNVACPLFTCTATNLPLVWIGANLHFVDVESGNLNMDPAALADLSRKVQLDAIVTVHYGGRVAAAGGRAWHLPLIEDCAQAVGAGLLFRNRPDFACFSFQAVKHITSGDGGMLCVSNAEDEEKARRMRWFGIDRKSKLDATGIWANDIHEVGFKYQMTDIAASMGLGSLETLDSQMEHRRALRARYQYWLAGFDGIRILDNDPESACWLMTVAAQRRESLITMLKGRGVESGLVHYRNDRYSVFAPWRRPGAFPNMDAIESEYLCLPLHMHMGIETVDYICDGIRRGWA